jgi:hypothetical protein
MVLAANGQIEFNNRTDHKGAVIQISLPCIYKKKAVLLDDNYLIGRLWKDEAKKSNVDFSYFSKISDLEAAIDQFDKDTEFYLDSELGDNLTGEEYAKSIYERGYKNISIVSGKTPAAFEGVHWVKSISGKEPPFK